MTTMSSEQYEAAARADMAREAQNIDWLTTGYNVLGLVQIARKDASGLSTEFVWQPRGQDQTGNLPSGVVERARQALSTEMSARQAYNSKREEALAYVAKHNLSSAAGQVHLELHCAESWTYYQSTLKPTRIAMRDLGQVAEDVSTARATLNGLSARQRTLDDQYKAGQAQIDTDRVNAQTTLQRYGLS